jgi:hypothetical protein
MAAMPNFETVLSQITKLRREIERKGFEDVFVSGSRNEIWLFADDEVRRARGPYDALLRIIRSSASVDDLWERLTSEQLFWGYCKHPTDGA